MKRHNNGFTLSEILISMAIIGVILAISINAIKLVKASYTALAYFAHRNIVNMVGVLYSGTITSSETTRGGDITDEDGKFIRRGIVTSQKLGVDSLIYDDGTTKEALQPMVTRCVNSKGKIVNVLKNDDEKYSSTVSCSARNNIAPGTNLFCKSLVALTNNAGTTRCDNAHLPAPSAGSEGDPTMSIPNLNEPNFTLTNGMRFYISSWSKNTNVSNDYGYRLITVDLNGKEKPNNENSVPTDLVTFLILDNGEVYPLGAAADNLTQNGKKIQYINARVKGYYYAYKNANNEVISRTTTPLECSNQKIDKYKCNFGVVQLKNDNEVKTTTTFSYREALCTAKKNLGIGYEKYCLLQSQSSLCPPSEDAKKFDMCSVETIKPMFRYNF